MAPTTGRRRVCTAHISRTFHPACSSQYLVPELQAVMGLWAVSPSHSSQYLSAVLMCHERKKHHPHPSSFFPPRYHLLPLPRRPPASPLPLLPLHPPLPPPFLNLLPASRAGSVDSDIIVLQRKTIVAANSQSQLHRLRHAVASSLLPLPQ